MKLEHNFNYTASLGVFKYAKVLGIKKDTNPISIERYTTTLRYIFKVRFITNTNIEELEILVILNSTNGNIVYKILSTDIPTVYYQHLPIVVGTDDGCDIYLSTFQQDGFSSIELEKGDPTNLILYPVGQATISEQDAFALENQATPTFQTNRIQAQTPVEISTDYGKIILLDLKNGTYLFKFIGNENTTSEHTIIATLPTAWRSRVNLNVWNMSLSKPASNNLGNIRVSPNGEVDANILEPYSVGNMIIIK